MLLNKFELLDGSHSVSDIQKYFEYIFKKHGKKLISWIRIFLNKIEKKITFKIKTGYYLELLNSETTKLLGSIKINITS